MTSNQISAKRAREEERANKANESFKNRETFVKEEDLKRQKKADTHKAIQGYIKNATDIGGVVAKFLGGKGKNHPSWYMKDELLANNVANLSYGEPLGSRAITKHVMSNPNGVEEKFKSGVPGLMVLRYTPMIPNTKLMETISKKLYAYVRHANSGHTNYEANDLMMYFSVVTELYTPILLGARLYSILNTYKSASYYYAKSYVEAMGFDYESFSNNISNFRAKLNTWIRRVNTFSIPKDFTLFERRAWLNLNIFKDYNIRRSNNYIFMPHLYYTFTEGADGFQLTPHKYILDNGDNLTFNEFCAIVDSVIDSIFDSEDVGIMSGDIMKAYGESGLYHLSEIDANFHIEETFDEAILSQISGATVMGEIIDDDVPSFTIFTDEYSKIRQANPNTNKTPTFTLVRDGGSSWFATVEKTPFINQYKDQVTPADNMVSTRLTAMAEVKREISGKKQERHLLNGCYGTEVITTVRIATLNSNSDNVIIEAWDGQVSFDSINLNDVTAIGFRVGQLCNFDWAPRLRQLVMTSDKASVYIIYDNLDLANYAPIAEETLFNIHSCALMSLYNV